MTKLIKNAMTIVELNEIAEQEAYDRNCELDNSMGYGEQADFLEQETRKMDADEARSLLELAEILREAETRWFELQD